MLYITEFMEQSELNKKHSFYKINTKVYISTNKGGVICQIQSFILANMIDVILNKKNEDLLYERK